MQVKLNDLSRQYTTIKKEIDSAISKVVSNTQFIGGEPVSKFENNFAKYNNVNYCIGCANGTDALEIALESLGLTTKDEVLIPAITWVSTAGAVRNIGAKPIFVDIDENDLIDIDKATEKITPNTKAIIPVHLFGQAVDMNKLMDFSKKHNLYVIEDCAQAHGAQWNGKNVGAFGDLGTFSFYPGKNLGAFGDAGGIITNNRELDKKCRMIRNHGQITKHEFLTKGRNSRLDTLQASVLTVKLNYLNQWTSRRREIAKKYNSLLQDTPVKFKPFSEVLNHVYHLFVIKTDQRDQLKKHLEEKGIQTAIHYPIALPFSETFNDSNKYPNSLLSTQTSLTIPLYPEIEDEEVEFVANEIKSFFNIK